MWDYLSHLYNLTFGDSRFYYLSLIQEEDPKLPKFTIHGLWPQYDLNNYHDFPDIL